MREFLNRLKKIFAPEWRFILDDCNIQFFMDGEPVNLYLDFSADRFLTDQSKFIGELRLELQKRFQNRALVRPLIKLELRGKLLNYKDSKIFEEVFIDGVGGRRIVIIK